MLAAPVSMSSYELFSVDLEGLFSWCPPFPLALSFCLPPLPQGSLNSEGRDLIDMSGCESLYLFASAAGGNFSEDG